MASSPYVLWGRLPLETLDREYKEFCSDSVSLLPKTHKEALISGNLTHFVDTLLIENLQKLYLYSILPKYISAMGNTEMEQEFGTFYIGIDDRGIVTGIPTTCVYFEEIVKKCVRNVVDTIRVQIKNDLHSNLLGSLVKTEVIELDYYEDLIDDDATKMVDDYIRAAQKTKEIEDAYLDVRSKENEVIFTYNIALSKLCNTEWYRKEVSEWISSDEYKDHLADLHQRGYLEGYVDGDHCLRELTDEEKTELLEFYSSSKEIDVDEDGGISLRRARVTDPLCWITLYRDFIIWQLKASRTKRPEIVYPRKIDDLLCHTLTPLTKRLLTNTPDIKYYIVKISIPTATKLKEVYRCEAEDISVEYNNNGSWTALIRRNIEPMGPSCVWC